MWLVWPDRSPVTLEAVLCIILGAMAALACKLAARRKKPLLEWQVGEYSAKLCKTTPIMSESGPARAIKLGDLTDFYMTFQRFIRGRNMHYIVSNIISPITAKYKVAYADMVRPGGHHHLAERQLDWFVSHHWGLTFRSTFESIKHHAKTYAPLLRVGAVSPENVKYWICSFSNNQHELDDDIPQSGPLDRCSFYKALTHDSCEGTAIIMDDEANTLTRIWCVYELFLTTTLRTEGRADFKGLIVCSDKGVLNEGKAGMDFAVNLAACLQCINVAGARASKPLDKKKIIDAINSSGMSCADLDEQVLSLLKDILDKSNTACQENLAKLKESLARPSVPAKHASTFSEGVYIQPVHLRAQREHRNSAPGAFGVTSFSIEIGS
eukprot:NODE_8861_length_1464_cov_5.495886.p1 GENE.NODE_8861_length_1464_cov_5.495886~~NODE_8861_length_1464_cov_5.495886.p1  ORF type:complete len:438 (-),score=71.81 NODE_8861_length_1464_cov_5.495886:151-1293(-)